MPFGIGLAACGSASNGARSASAGSSVPATVRTSPDTSTQNLTKSDSEKDNDGGAFDDRNNDVVLRYGHAASSSGEHTIVALVKTYYAAALTGDGAKACSMLPSQLVEAVPEDYGQSPPGPSYMRGKTCPEVLTKLFEHFHSQLTLEVPKLAVTHVRLDGRRGLAVLMFGKLPERQIQITREGQTWKIAVLLDTELP